MGFRPGTRSCWLKGGGHHEGKELEDDPSDAITGGEKQPESGFSGKGGS